MKTAWITVNYKQEKFVDSWLHSIKNQAGNGEADVFIVDNSRTLRDGIKQATIFRPEDNLGYFGGFNYCLGQINLNIYDAIVFTNPDVSFADDFLIQLRKYLDHELDEDVMIVAPRITLNSGVEQNPHSAKAFSRMRKIYFRFLFSSMVNYVLLGSVSRILKRIFTRRSIVLKRQTIFLAHGACFIGTRNFFKKCGRLNQQVFLWGEEVFLMNQVKKNGGKILFIPDLRVFHHEHSATRFITSRNRFELMRKSYSIYRKFL
jgi:GT2 family glycosyltransferase